MGDERHEKRRYIVDTTTSQEKGIPRASSRRTSMARYINGNLIRTVLLGCSLLALLAYIVLHLQQTYVVPSQPLRGNAVDWDYVARVSPDVRVKAALVALVRDEDLYRLRSAMQDVEGRFNQGRGYPWVILSDKPFSSEFHVWVADTTTAPLYFGLVPPEEWKEPEWIQADRVEETEQRMRLLNLNHGNTLGWRRMARYNTGFIARHPLLQNLEYYWKVQPDSRVHCDMPQDPFEYMKQNHKKLSFAITMHESLDTITSLWSTVQQFILAKQHLIQPTEKSLFPWLVHQPVHPSAEDLAKKEMMGDYWGDYNLCHVWNNLQIVSLDYLRSPAYLEFFEHLDRAGGFFYERWSDAVAQTMAAALLLQSHEIHFMDDIGYSFSVATQCPTDPSTHTRLHCICNANTSFENHPASCTPKLRRQLQQGQRITP